MCMQQLFRRFDMARIVFFITFLALFCVGMPVTPVFAANSPFAVKGVEVDILDESSVKARNRAFIEAQRKAFEILATRYYAEGELKTLKIPSDDVLSGFIQDFKIASEQVSTKRYKGVFDFRFKAAAVNQHFGRGPINYVEDEANVAGKVLLIPFYHEEKKPVVFNKAQNPFWGSLLVDIANYKNVILPEGNIQDVTDIGNKGPVTLTPNIIRRLKARYDVNKVVVATASLDLEDQTTLSVALSNASSGALVDYKTLRVDPKKVGTETLQEAENFSKPQKATSVVGQNDVTVGETPSVAQGEQTPGGVSAVAESEINPNYFMTQQQRIEKAQEAREKAIELARQKKELSSNNNPIFPGLRGEDIAGAEEEKAEQGEINVQVFFNSMSEWVETQKKLSRLDGLRGIRIVTLKTNQGDTVIEYSDWKQLLVSMKNVGYVLEPQSADLYTLKKLSADF